MTDPLKESVYIRKYHKRKVRGPMMLPGLLSLRSPSGRTKVLQQLSPTDEQHSLSHCSFGEHTCCVRVCFSLPFFPSRSPHIKIHVREFISFFLGKLPSLPLWRAAVESATRFREWRISLCERRGFKNVWPKTVIRDPTIKLYDQDLSAHC